MAERVPTSALNRASGELVTRASMGESFELTRHGKVVARLLPPEREPESVAAQADAHLAASPQLRPAPEVSRQQAQTAQQRRDELLRGARRGR